MRKIDFKKIGLAAMMLRKHYRKQNLEMVYILIQV